MQPITYPPTKQVDHVDDYHGTLVADPYRWLEDLDAEDTAAFVAAQNEVTFAYLDRIPYRAAWKRRLEQVWDYDKYGAPQRLGDGSYLYARQTGLQNQFTVHVTADPKADGRLLLDPNEWSADGTVALTSWSPSDDGRLLAYAIASGGSDWNEWKVVDVASGEHLADHITKTKFSGASWDHEGAGFYYSRYDDVPADAGLERMNLNHKVYYHRLGAPQAEDELVYERPDHPDWLLFGAVSEDGRWLVVTAARGTDPQNGLFVKDLSKPGATIEPLFDAFDAEYLFLGNDGERFYVKTDLDAPRGRVVAVDNGAVTDLVPEQPDALQAVSLVGDHFFAQYLHDAHSLVRVHHLDGSPEREVELPGLGTATGFAGKRTDSETYFGFTSFTTPNEIWRYDVASGSAERLRRPEVAFDPDAFETTQVFYESKDGTRVPMFLTHKRGLARDGSNPTYLYGYGGFNVPQTPAFAITMVPWLEMGGVYAVANIRGGSEYGEEWHQAGVKHNRQNVFDDFIAAGEWLIASGVTSSARLAIGGGSNGGLLVGACITQRPDLFGAARAAVGVLDMLRFHTFTIGWAWTSDYGSADDPEDFKTIYAYSPLHNLRPGTAYPSLILTTADHDDRVVPSHSFKFAAAIQAAQGGPRPVLLRVDVRAGHGMGKPTAKLIEEAADVFSFLAHELGVESVPWA
ncbi:MAG TPA: prolyl oligopeptidase family serine peptidase [Actinomycetota bacterium]